MLGYFLKKIKINCHVNKVEQNENFYYLKFYSLDNKIIKKKKLS
jgi:hypothetical protein